MFRPARFQSSWKIGVYILPPDSVESKKCTACGSIFDVYKTIYKITAFIIGVLRRQRYGSETFELCPSRL